MNNMASIFKQLITLPLGCCVLCGQQSDAVCCATCEKDFLPWGHSAAKLSSAALDAILTAYIFAYPLDHVIHALKYQQNLAVAKWLSGQLVPLLRDEIAQNPVDIIIGMPLHAKRLRVRGFNQSHEIARHLAAEFGIPCRTGACIRKLHLRPQVELTLAERRALPENLFECTEDLDGQHALLVDDVLTTGASLDRLACAVKKQGALRVTACVVARVP